MLNLLLILFFVHLAASSPLYRLEPEESVPSPIPEEFPQPPIQTVPGDSPLPQGLVPNVTLPPDPVASTEKVPAEEIRTVVNHIVENFDMEMSKSAERERPQLVDNKLTKEMEAIRKPGTIVDTAAETKIKMATLSPPTTPQTVASTPSTTRMAAGIPIDELAEVEENREVNQGMDEFEPIDSKTAETNEMEEDDLDGPVIPELATGRKTVEPLSPKVEPPLNPELGVKQEEPVKLVVPPSNKNEEPCDRTIPVVPGGPGESKLIPFDEETTYRIIVYALSLLADTVEDQPSTWQKVIAGIQCILRDCRGALPLRPTSSFPLDENSFIIRRARESLCPCILFDNDG